MNDYKSHRQRLQSLSANRRLLLAHRLGLPPATTADGTPAGGSDRKRLLAYIECETLESGLDTEIEDYGRSRLPAYMAPESVILVQRLPRTPAGKIDRDALRWIQPADTAPEENAVVAPRTETERILAEIWCEVIGIDELSVHDNFFEVGGDSLLSIRILARARQQGLQITPDKFFSSPTIEAQALQVGEINSAKIETGPVTGAVPLLPIQLWFFNQITVDPQQWSQSLLLQIDERLEFQMLERALQQLLIHHDALRSSFHRSGADWSQIFQEPDLDLPLEAIDLSICDESLIASELENKIATVCESLLLNEAPLLRLVCFNMPGSSPKLLFMVAHHLLLDAHAWHIFVQDMETLCGQLLAGETMSLPPKTNSVKDWAGRLTEHAQSDELQKQRDYWLGIVEPAAALPTDFPSPPHDNREQTGETVERSLGEAQTQELLHEVPRSYSTQINDALLAALGQTIGGWSNKSEVYLDLEGHGRESLFDDLDISRTIGWFTSVYPVKLTVDTSADPGQQLVTVKEQLRRIPDHGMGHGLLTYLSADQQLKARLATASRPQLCFNYLGQTHHQSGLLRPLEMNTGPVRSGRSPRAYLLEVNVSVVDNSLHASWTYSSKFHTRETIEQLAKTYIANLERLIAHCRSRENGTRTPSDFPLSGLDQSQLDGLAELLGKIDDPDGPG